MPSKTADQSGNRPFMAAFNDCNTLSSLPRALAFRSSPYGLSRRGHQAAHPAPGLGHHAEDHVRTDGAHARAPTPCGTRPRGTPGWSDKPRFRALALGLRPRPRGGAKLGRIGASRYIPSLKKPRPPRSQREHRSCLDGQILAGVHKRRLYSELTRKISMKSPSVQ
jgi:hypothetical protein